MTGSLLNMIEPTEPSESAADDVESAVAGRRPRTPTSVLADGWHWFGMWRRTRPFWGGLWMILAGLWIVQAMNFSIGLALTGGWSYAAGYVMGGGLALFGLVAWVAPHYRTLTGLVGFLIAVAAFPTANLGGYLIGSVVGIIGASMVWAWGEKKPRAPRGSRRGGAGAAVAADEDSGA
jgi:hypothetical protein